MVLNKYRQFIKIYFKSSTIPLKDRMIQFCVVCFIGDIPPFFGGRLRTRVEDGGEAKAMSLNALKFFIKCDRIICPFEHPASSEFLISLLERFERFSATDFVVVEAAGFGQLLLKNSQNVA